MKPFFGLDYGLAVIVGTLCLVSYTLLRRFFSRFVDGSGAGTVDVGGVADSTCSRDKWRLWRSLWRPSSQEPCAGDGFCRCKWAGSIWCGDYFTRWPGGLAILASLTFWPGSKQRVATVTSQSARRIAVTWSALCMLGAVLVGLVGILFVDNQLAGELADGEKIFMLLANAVFHPVVAGILLAAILAAIMSTADSQLLVSSSALAEDFYKQLIRPTASPEEIVMGVTRLPRARNHRC